MWDTIALHEDILFTEPCACFAMLIDNDYRFSVSK